MEMLSRDDKFFCDTCGCLQEAQKRLLLQQLPQCLIFHLKRFKYMEQLNRWGGVCRGLGFRAQAG
jgi:ubiquitin C-terminal hydrolase